MDATELALREKLLETQKENLRLRTILDNIYRTSKTYLFNEFPKEEPLDQQDP